ncbi:ankyrin [Penicillium verhagenii]|nr:ankyrin [Penicillium verhagenii]
MWLGMPNVDINAKNRWGATALHEAARHIAPIAKAFIEILISQPDIDLNPEDELGRREPLINAARQGWPDLVLSMLRRLTSDEIEKHLDLHERNILHWTITAGMIDASFLAIRKNPMIVSATDTRGITPLHLAAQAGQDQIAKALLVYGASPTHQTRFGETPLHMAAAEGHMRVLKRLIKTLPTPSEINRKDIMGWTVTHRAVISGNEDLQRFLVSLPDVDLKKPDRHGRTPIAFAASLASLNTLEIFLQSRPNDINFVDEFGNTLLHLAAKGNNEATIPFLLAAIGRKGNKFNDWGQTTLDLLPMESPLRAKLILSGLVHSANFFNRKPHCCFGDIRPKTPKVHYDWMMTKQQRVEYQYPPNPPIYHPAASFATAE